MSLPGGDVQAGGQEVIGVVVLLARRRFFLLDDRVEYLRSVTFEHFANAVDGERGG